MNAAEIVIREVQRNGGFQMRQPFAERIREPRKTPHRHSHGQVLPLDERRTDVFGIGIAHSDFGYNPRDAWWGVPRFGSVKLPVIAKHLRKLREVAFGSKALRNAHGVVVQSIRGELHAVGNALIQVPEKGPRIRPHALADAKRRHQLGLRVDGNVNPLVANFGRIAAPHVAPFLSDVAPDFIDLQIPGAEVSHSRVHELDAALTSNQQEAHDRVSIEASEPLCAANRAPFQKAVQRPFCCIGIRNQHISREPLVGFAEGGIAGLAAPTLDAALTEVTELFAGLVLASYAGHGFSPLDFSAELSHNEFGSGSWLTPRSGLALPTAPTGDRAAFSQLVNGGGLPTVGLLSCATALRSSAGPFVFDSEKSFLSSHPASAVCIHRHGERGRRDSLSVSHLATFERLCFDLYIDHPLESCADRRETTVGGRTKVETDRLQVVSYFRGRQEFPAICRERHQDALFEAGRPFLDSFGFLARANLLYGCKHVECALQQGSQLRDFRFNRFPFSGQLLVLRGQFQEEFFVINRHR
jgi:hypothetical protein